MNTITRPLLAATLEDIETIVYPVLVTPKLDGIRVLKVNNNVVTRKFKELPNTNVREKLQFILPNGIDGEVMLRNGDFNKIQSEIMSFEGEPDYIFYAFDYVKDDLEKTYEQRCADLVDWYNNLLLKFIALSKLPFGAVTVDPDNFKDKIRLLTPKRINNKEELLLFEEKCLSEGYEGIMIRSPQGKYKCGRSTLKEKILSKLKRFKDEEGEVVGFEEKLHNDNAQEKDEFGLAKRSSKKEGLKPANTLGSLIVKMNNGIIFGIGSGFDDTLKQEIWNNQSKYLGKIVKYKYQEIGPKGAPRFPVFLGFRNQDDL